MLQMAKETVAALNIGGAGSYGSAKPKPSPSTPAPVYIKRDPNANPLATKLLHAVTEYLHANPENGVSFSTGLNRHVVSFNNVSCRGKLSLDDFAAKIQELVTSIVRSSRLKQRSLEVQITADTTANRAPFRYGLDIQTKAGN
jgi:hypothetical protein